MNVKHFPLLIFELFLLIILVITLTFCDDSCIAQNQVLVDAEMKAKDFQLVEVFDEYTNQSNIELTWAGDNKGITIVSFTSRKPNIPSKLALSDESGVHFTSIIKDKIFIYPVNGLYRNPNDHKNLYVFCSDPNNSNKGIVYVSNNIYHWNNYSLPFVPNPNSQISHNHNQGLDQFLILDLKSTLHLTKDRMKTWVVVARGVKKFDWNPNNSTQIYLLIEDNGYKHMKIYTVPTASMSDVPSTKGIYSYVAKAKFLFVSIFDAFYNGKRRLIVSTDNGVTFNNVQLPHVTSNQFYAILDVDDDMVFIHVDDPGNAGSGTIYTSNSRGILFSESLTNHFYPEEADKSSDFYKVLSLRGTYITNRIDTTKKTLETFITHNRGATWSHLAKPDNANCSPNSKQCNLHLSLQFSLSKSVSASLPLSVSNAPGIILAHGHTADVSKTSPPDVYTSSDGGYTWIKSLDGPHHYEIADHGGLLIAVSKMSNTPNTVKFSTDEGRCWHTFKFTDKKINFTRLLTEHGNRGLNVSLWGYSIKNGSPVWQVSVLHFGEIIINSCTEKDYEDWVPHSQQKNQDGCLLGKKEKIKRLKKDSLCSNGYAHEITKSDEFCECTSLDFECEYGYSRRENSMDCTKDNNVKDLNACMKSSIEIIKSDGYRKIPGDACQKGFSPNPSKQEILRQNCDDSKQIYDNKVTLLVIGLCGLFIVGILFFVLATRYHHLRSKLKSIRYTDLMTQANQNGDDSALLLDTDSPELPIDSDDDLVGNSTNFAHKYSNGNAVGLPGAPTTHSKHTPGLEFHDDSDVEMVT